MQYIKSRNKISNIVCNLNSRHLFWISAFIIFTTFFSLFSEICFPFVVAFLLAYLFVPIISWLSEYKYLNRTFLNLLFSIGSVLILLVIIAELAPKLKNYLIYLHNKIPEYYSLFIAFINDTFSFINIDTESIDGVKHEVEKYMGQKIYVFASIIESLAERSKEITRFFSFFVIMPVSLFYFLEDWEHMTCFMFRCVPIRHRKTISEITDLIRSTLKNLIYWQFYIVFSLFVYYAVMLRLVSVEHNLYLGMTSGLLSFIPFVGCFFSCILVIFISIPTLTMTKFYLILATYLVGQFIEGYILYPHFVGKKTGLHPLWILFSFFAGVELKGIIGVLIAIPSTAIIRSLGIYSLNKLKSTLAWKQ